MFLKRSSKRRPFFYFLHFSIAADGSASGSSAFANRAVGICKRALESQHGNLPGRIHNSIKAYQNDKEDIQKDDKKQNV